MSYARRDTYTQPLLTTTLIQSKEEAPVEGYRSHYTGSKYFLLNSFISVDEDLMDMDSKWKCTLFLFSSRHQTLIWTNVSPGSESWILSLPFISTQSRYHIPLYSIPELPLTWETPTYLYSRSRPSLLHSYRLTTLTQPIPHLGSPFFVRLTFKTPDSRFGCRFRSQDGFVVVSSP